MNKFKRTVLVLFSVILLIACILQPVCAKEFSDPGSGISMSYPDDFYLRTSVPGSLYAVTEPTILQWITASPSEGANFAAALKAHIIWGQDLKIGDAKESANADGSKTFVSKVTYTTKAEQYGKVTYYDTTALTIGIQRGSKWAIATFSTIPEYAPYDEAAFLKVLQTLKMK
jgi:hypothetical protein